VSGIFLKVQILRYQVIRFKKEILCGRCGLQLPKQQLGIFDTTHQGKRKQGEQIRLCQSCMIEALIEQISNFQGRAIFVYPSDKFNAYVFYQFNELEENIKYSRHYDKDADFIKDMRELLPSNHAVCTDCNDSALFTWASLELFDDDPYSWQVKRKIELEHIYLCKKCLINYLLDKLKTDNIQLSAIYPPIEGDGFCTPWDI